MESVLPTSESDSNLKPKIPRPFEATAKQIHSNYKTMNHQPTRPHQFVDSHQGQQLQFTQPSATTSQQLLVPMRQEVEHQQHVIMGHHQQPTVCSQQPPEDCTLIENGKWQSDKDYQWRRKMIRNIVFLAQQRKPNPQAEWLEKLPWMANRLEASLYKSAISFAEYNDASTLERRLRQQAAVWSQQPPEGCTLIENGRWQSDKDYQGRRKMIQNIVLLLQQRKPNPPAEWLEKLPWMAKQLEVSLYKAAISFAEYNDASTLERRLRQLVVNIRLKTKKMRQPRILQLQRGLQQQGVQQRQKLMRGKHSIQQQQHTNSLTNASFILSTSKLRTKVMELLCLLQSSHQHAWVFNTPVDPVELELPDYFKFIKHPMDLGTVRKNLENGAYKTLAEVEQHILLTFDNAMLYNRVDSVVYNIASEMKSTFQGAFSVLLVQLLAEEQVPQQKQAAPVQQPVQQFAPRRQVMGQEQHVQAQQVVTCPVCYEDKQEENAVEILPTCKHEAICKSCLGKWWKTCAALRKEHPTCPACLQTVEDDSSAAIVTVLGCGFQEFVARKRQELENDRNNGQQADGGQILDEFTQNWLEENGAVACPHCSAWIVREGGCSAMMCRCGGTFCFSCGDPLAMSNNGRVEGGCSCRPLRRGEFFDNVRREHSSACAREDRRANERLDWPCPF